MVSEIETPSRWAHAVCLIGTDFDAGLLEGLIITLEIQLAIVVTESG